MPSYAASAASSYRPRYIQASVRLTAAEAIACADQRSDDAVPTRRSRRKQQERGLERNQRIAVLAAPLVRLASHRGERSEGSAFRAARDPSLCTGDGRVEIARFERGLCR